MEVVKWPRNRAALRLVTLLARNGCFRFPREDLRREFGLLYRKGWEVRFVLESEKEVAEVRRLVQRLGLRPGGSYRKRNQWVQPIYGELAVKMFSSWLRAAPNTAPKEMPAAVAEPQ